MTKLVIAFTIAAVAGVVTGNQSCFASEQSSPDKQWEYQSSVKQKNRRSLKAGTRQIVRDLGSDCGYGKNALPRGVETFELGKDSLALGFIFTLKFDSDGNWKIVKTRSLSKEEAIYE
jgi:hypothetical protein